MAADADFPKLMSTVIPQCLANDGQVSKVWRARLSWALIYYGVAVFVYHLVLHPVTHREKGVVVLMGVLHVVCALSSFVEFRTRTAAKSLDGWAIPFGVTALLMCAQHLLFFTIHYDTHYAFWATVVGAPVVAVSVAVTCCCVYMLAQCVRTFGIRCLQTPLLVLDVMVGYTLFCITYFCLLSGWWVLVCVAALYCSVYGFIVCLHVIAYAWVAFDDGNVEVYICVYIICQSVHVACVGPFFACLLDHLGKQFGSLMFLDTFWVILVLSVAFFGCSSIAKMAGWMWKRIVYMWDCMFHIDVRATLDNALMV